MSKVLQAMALGVAAACALPAAAHEKAYAAPLLGSSEVPAASTPATGTARVTIDLDMVTMRVEADFSGLLGNVTAAHIHCCTPPGSNVMVATQLPSFSGFPLGVTAGSYDRTFDLALADSYNPAFITGHGGTVGSAFNALVAGLDANQAYLNIHTNQFPGGEIRALLAPVPEPQAYALMLAGLMGVGAVMRRRRAA